MLRFRTLGTSRACQTRSCRAETNAVAYSTETAAPCGEGSGARQHKAYEAGTAFAGMPRACAYALSWAASCRKRTVSASKCIAQKVRHGSWFHVNSKSSSKKAWKCLAPGATWFRCVMRGLRHPSTMQKLALFLTESANSIPCRSRHTISLYANISSLRWDYSSENVKGWVTSASGNGLRAFELVRQPPSSIS
jgi:hypothetical protein